MMFISKRREIERQDIFMEVRNCRGCGRLFNYVAGPFLCQICKEQLEGKFQEVKEYVREHKGIGIRELSDACDVPVNQIQQWLREERLEVTEESAIYLSCEACGCNIRSGRYCDKCKNAMTNGFRNILNSAKPKVEVPKKDTKNPAKMRFLD